MCSDLQKKREEALRRLYEVVDKQNEAAKTGVTYDMSTTDYTMKCCGNKGFAIYDYAKSQWECSECKSVLSNDPNYVHSYVSSPWLTGENWWTPKVVHPKEPHIPAQTQFVNECTCGAHAINSNKHSPWCDWRSGAV